ncbi:hypothetical protein GWI33_001930 [Rhynchophorus ferrugineus]|uniref:Uncharacterized protein n=1 Tax=Rhynchophorus ferrugineus TaxID=354439 RepID=A0A834IKU2_RHYFE|nr:hypothetical protein GWI33_001930 [Rhynchophorus ferrugineus]
MGSVASAHRPQEDDIWWTNGQTTEPQQAPRSDATSLNRLSEKNQLILNDFKFDMERKHEKRREILAAKKREFDDLREEVARLRKENETLKLQSPDDSSDGSRRLGEEECRLRDSVEVERLANENRTLKSELKDKLEELQKAANLLDANRELKTNIAEMQEELQKLNGVVVEFEKEREEYKNHVVALKDVVNVSKKMLLLRESQLKELKLKVESIEESLSTKEMTILSKDLRQEYERQLQSIRNLRTLYEERQRSDHREKEELKRSLEEVKKELEEEQKKNSEATERIDELEEMNSKKYDEIKALESNLGLANAESRQHQAELTVINQLFSEILLGFNNNQDIDLDKLMVTLKDHHELLQNMVVSELSSASSSALPKVLLDLVSQVSAQEHCDRDDNSSYKLETIVEESESQTPSDQINSVEEIVELLPKVWRVLIELLSHQKAPTNILTHEATSQDDPCYKTVQTPKGPSLVVSVSQTFIRLKDLILEKKSLEKETGHLKQLNTHLENRLQDQERRLQMVSSELDKTWHVVGKLQKQHQLLHTQEKILRYELAQKRKLLNTLKEELEYSREKWQEAREKNSKTEKQWKQLRVEFASRRNTVLSDELNNSQESGYSDERSSDDEPGYESDASETGLKPSTVEEEIPDQKDPEPADENDSNDVQKTSYCLVSSVIEEAIAAIVKNEEATCNNHSDEHTADNLVSTNSEEQPAPSTSQSSTISAAEDRLSAREQRLRRLEGLCGQLVEQVTNTTKKGEAISNKLDSLHETYGDGSVSMSNTVSCTAEDNTGLKDDADSNQK